VRGRGAPAETGSASIVVVALTGLLVLLGVAATFVVATVAAHRRVQAAADLAALAGATSAQSASADDPCAAAARVAAGNGARLSSCQLVGTDVLVTAEVQGPRFLGHSRVLEGRARAGPGRPG
jgi:secretion/DNA translocation related TadE-like protein